MATTREKLLHPATLIACAALAVSLGGTTYAATTIGTAQLRDEAVSTPKLADGAVAKAKLRNGAVTTPKLASGAVTAQKIASGAVTARAIGPGAVGATQIAPGAIGQAALAPGAVGSAAIAPGAVTGAQVANGSIGVEDLEPGLASSVRGAVVSNRASVPDGSSARILEIPGLGVLSATCGARAAVTRYTNQSGQVQDVHFWGQTSGVESPTVSGHETTPHGATIEAPNNGFGPHIVWWQVGHTDAAGVPHVATIHASSDFDDTSCLVLAQAVTTG